MIDWVFFDIGSVLFHDDRQNFYSYLHAHRSIASEQPDYSFEQMLTEREALARDGTSWILHQIARRLLSEESARVMFAEIRGHLESNYDTYHLLNDGAREVLSRLSERFRLGVIANQPRECRNSLARRGLLGQFEVVAISDELDLHKPDVQLYEWAIREAGCDPKRAVMIGDRPDNDVAPAQKLSMKTVLMPSPGRKQNQWQPDDPQAIAFLESCERVPLLARGDTEIQPDHVVESLHEAADAVEAMAGSVLETE